jgi:hypothetical protein
MAMKRFLAALFSLIPTFALAAGLSGDGFGSSGPFQYNAIPFPPVSTGLITPVMSVFNMPASGINADFGGIGGVGPVSTTSLTTTGRKIPIPVDGTISALAAGFSTTQAAGTTISINLNGGTGNTGCIYATASPFNCNYSGTGDHVAAGTLAQWRMRLPFGSTWVSGGPAKASFLFQADQGQNGPIFSAPNSTAFASTTEFEGVGTPQVSPVETIASVVQPAIGQIAGIYAYPNASDNGANVHTYTLVKNGTATALACSGDPANPTLGCCANVGGTGNIGGSSLSPCSSITAITVAVGDTLSIQVTCGGTCASINPGMSLIWQPTTAGQVPLYNLTNSPSQTVPFFSSAVDASFSQTVATNWNFTPNLASTMTLSKLLACTTSTITTGTWGDQFQYSTTLVAPATNSALVATYGSSNTCPGSSGILHSGFQDTTDTQAVSAGYTLGFNIIPTGTPTGATRWKASMVATVP